MKVELIHNYQASLDEVIRFFSEPELIEEKYLAIGARDPKVSELAETDEGFDVVTEREVPAKVPSILKSILGAYNKAVQKERWSWVDDDTLRCELSVELIGVPVRVSGTMELHGAAGGATCQNLVNITVASSVPFVGGALSDFVANDIERLGDKEYEEITKRLLTLEPLA